MIFKKRFLIFFENLESKGTVPCLIIRGLGKPAVAYCIQWALRKNY